MIFISGLIKTGLGDDIMTEDYSAHCKPSDCLDKDGLSCLQKLD